tara:strand:- start:81 stop:377 length:297 start_codon:yes stop_codon:yes gene_type:complete
MITKKVTRYYADCGKGFWSKSGALNHEGNCKCWGNVKNRTCKTCKFGGYLEYEDDTGDGGIWECGHIKVEEHSGAPSDIKYISVNCQHYSETRKGECK